MQQKGLRVAVGKLGKVLLLAGPPHSLHASDACMMIMQTPVIRSSQSNTTVLLSGMGVCCRCFYDNGTAPYYHLTASLVEALFIDLTTHGRFLN